MDELASSAPCIAYRSNLERNVLLSPFNPDASIALAGPDWLRTRRIDAMARFDAASFPSTEEEIWRYSRIAEVDLDSWVLASVPDNTVPAGQQAVIDAYPNRAGLVVVRNGVVIHTDLAPELATKGVQFGSALTIEVAEELFDLALAEHRTDLFADLNGAFSVDPVILDVPAGVVVEEPFVVVGWLDEDGAAVMPRLVVKAGEGADVAVVDHLGSADCRAMVMPVVELIAEQTARLGYVGIQDTGRDVWQIGSQVSQVGAQATLSAGVAALGGAYARQRTDCRLVGRGATGNLRAVYLGDGEQTLDFRTFQEHVAPDTTSDLLFKGAVDDKSRSVYTGMIRVHPDARGTNAFQTNRNIMLSEDAWAESVPNLEIENNDVKCSHASTVGPIDEDQRFYLESRGVPPGIAERLVVGGFFDEVFDALPVRAAGDWLRGTVDRLLNSRDLGHGRTPK